MSLAVVEVGQIFEVIWVSLVAGIGITTVFSLVVLGMGRYGEARRTGRGTAALAYGAMTLLFLGLFAGGMVLAVQIMLSKDV